MTLLLLYAAPDTLHFQLRKQSRIVASGKFGRLNTSAAFFEIQRAGEEPYSESTGAIDHRAALRKLVDYFQRNQHILAIDDILTVVHRIPHGGRSFGSAVHLNREAAERLEKILRAHKSLPAATVVRAALNQLPHARHVGVVGTGIYKDLPVGVAAHPEMRRAFESAVGNNGSLHEAATLAAHDLLHIKRHVRTVSVRIDDRVTITALHAGRALATSDQVSAIASVPGLNNAGAIDPATTLGIAQALDTETWRIAENLAERSGLAAMTGKKTYAEIEAGAKAGEAPCVEALMLLCERIAFVVAGMASVLGAIELVVFSGPGASWTIIEEVCSRLPADVRKGKANAVLSTTTSKTKVVWIEQSLDDALLRIAKPMLRRAPVQREITRKKSSRREKRR